MSAVSIRDEVTRLKRERTVEAAAQLFYDHGYEQTTLDSVAERLGVTKPFIYTHFRSKADLLADICTRGISDALRVIDEATALTAPTSEQLRYLARNFVISVLDNQRYIAILTREEKNLAPADFERLSDLRRQFDRRLVSLLEAGRSAGEFHLADPAVAALAIGGMVSWAYVWYRPHGRLGRDALADEIADLILAMAGVSK